MTLLANRRILVTGAASGQGRAIAERFAAEGARLALLDMNVVGVGEVADRLGAAAFGCDVSDEAQVHTSVQAAVAALGGLDGIVNAAGVLATKAFEDTDRSTWDKLIAVNLGGPYNITQAALPALREAAQATIVNIASISGVLPMINSTAYATCKAGLIMFTKCLAVDLGPKIRANAILPGVIRTEMVRYLWENPENLERVSNRVALKMIGEPEHVAEAALFLSGPGSSFTTGTELVVDGGFSWR